MALPEGGSPRSGEQGFLDGQRRSGVVAAGPAQVGEGAPASLSRPVRRYPGEDRGGDLDIRHRTVPAVRHRYTQMAEHAIQAVRAELRVGAPGQPEVSRNEAAARCVQAAR